jgi:hypothetical protein
LKDKALVLVTHHPPYHPHVLPIVRWLDGLRGYAEVLQLLGRHPRLQLLHGHLHRGVDRIVFPTAHTRRSGLEVRLVAKDNAKNSEPTRVFGAPATCDGPEDAPRIRLYDVNDGALHAEGSEAA